MNITVHGQNQVYRYVCVLGYLEARLHKFCCSSIFGGVIQLFQLIFDFFVLLPPFSKVLESIQLATPARRVANYAFCKITKLSM